METFRYQSFIRPKYKSSVNVLKERMVYEESKGLIKERIKEGLYIESLVENKVTNLRGKSL